MKKTNNAIRIIGGKFRGKKITFPDAQGLRPTPDRIRETLFNWLMHDIRGAACLDLFSGSGALGFEAVSRGAAQVVMVEKNPQVYARLQHNAAILQIERMTLISTTAESYLQSAPPITFDIVFLDPPFAEPNLYTCIHFFEQNTLLKTQGLLYIEAPNDLKLDPTIWKNLKLKTAGQITYGLYQKI